MDNRTGTGFRALEGFSPRRLNRRPLWNSLFITTFPDQDLLLSLNRTINYISNMKTLTINIPNTADIDDKEARMSLASKLYKRGKLTLDQAAELAGYSKETFLELLFEYNVSLINYPADELDEDIENAKRYST